MTHIIGRDRAQTLLLPEALDDYVGKATDWRSARLFWTAAESPSSTRSAPSSGE